MQLEKLTLHVVGGDPYDHSRYSVETNTGDIRNDSYAWSTYEKYLAKIKETKSKGFYKIYVVDLEAGTNELVMEVVNPEKQRLELNVKAKPAGGMKPKRKTASDILMESMVTLNTQSSFFVSETAPHSAPSFTSMDWPTTTAGASSDS